MIVDQRRQQLAEEAAVTGAKPRTFSLSAAHQAYKRHLGSMPKEEHDELTALRAGQLEYLWTQGMALLRRTYYAHSTTTGALVEGPDGTPLEDVSPKLTALRELRYINESMRKLRGLDAPSRRIVEYVPEEAVEQEIRRREEELALLEARYGVEAPEHSAAG